MKGKKTLWASPSVWHSVEWWCHHHTMGVVFRGRDRETGQNREKDECSHIQTWSTQSRQYYETKVRGFSTGLWMWLSDLAKTQNWMEFHMNSQYLFIYSNWDGKDLKGRMKETAQKLKQT